MNDGKKGRGKHSTALSTTRENEVQQVKRQKRARTLGPAWLRWILFFGGSLCMGLSVAVAVQWVITGSLSIVWEWFVKWPAYLLLTGVLYSAVVFTLGAQLGRL